MFYRQRTLQKSHKMTIILNQSPVEVYGHIQVQQLCHILSYLPSQLQPTLMGNNLFYVDDVRRPSKLGLKKQKLT